MGFCMNPCESFSARLTSLSSSSSFVLLNSSKSSIPKSGFIHFLLNSNKRKGTKKKNFSALNLSLQSSGSRVGSVRCGNVVKATKDDLGNASFENGGLSQAVGKRTDLKKIMILGAGPIVIGQACEFDYSGTQACKALKEEGYQVVLLNSNPATIMTDPDLADRTYIAPMTPELVEQILEKERPDAI